MRIGGKGPFCTGTTCLLAWCKENTFDAKDFWSKHGKRCANCQEVYRTDREGVNGCLVVNARLERDGLGAIELEGHAAPTQALMFCGPTCVVEFFAKEPKTKAKLLHRVPASKHKVEMDDEGGCKQCHRHARRYVAVDAPYWSMWDSLNVPNYFCSVACLVEAFRRDERHCKKYQFGKWFAPLPPVERRQSKRASSPKG